MMIIARSPVFSNKMGSKSALITFPTDFNNPFSVFIFIQCWENCGLLQDNPTVWSRICSQPSVCVSFSSFSSPCLKSNDSADAAAELLRLHNWPWGGGRSGTGWKHKTGVIMSSPTVALCPFKEKKKARQKWT